MSPRTPIDSTSPAKAAKPNDVKHVLRTTGQGCPETLQVALHASVTRRPASDVSTSSSCPASCRTPLPSTARSTLDGRGRWENLHAQRRVTGRLGTAAATLVSRRSCPVRDTAARGAFALQAKIGNGLRG